MSKFILKVLVNAAALWVAAALFDGIRLSTEFISVLAVALVLGVVNALVRPVLIILTIPFTILTLGLFLLVINAFTLSLTAYLMPGLDVDGFLPALGGAIVISIVGMILTRIIVPKDKKMDKH